MADVRVMTDKNLREAAEKHAEEVFGKEHPAGKLCSEYDFIAGAEWARAEVLKTLREPATIEFHNDGSGWADWLEKQWNEER